MQNGTKNYSIPDINISDTDKLSVSEYTKNGSTSYYSAKVTIADAQSLFLFGGLIQSKATQSSNSQLADNDSYSNTYYRTTHIASYASVGADTPGTEPPTNTEHDYYKAENDGYSGSGVNPYIVYKYANGYSGLYRVTNSYSTLNIQLGADNADATTFYLPDGFKGLGSYLASDNYISLFEFNGQGNTVSMGSSLKYYHKPVVYTTTSYAEIYNYMPALFGFGFFNCLRQNRENTGFSTAPLLSIHDLTLSGNVEAQVYQTSGDISGYDYGQDQRYIDIGIVSVGGLAGLAGNGKSGSTEVLNHLPRIRLFFKTIFLYPNDIKRMIGGQRIKRIMAVVRDNNEQFLPLHPIIYILSIEFFTYKVYNESVKVKTFLICVCGVLCWVSDLRNTHDQGDD